MKFDFVYARDEDYGFSGWAPVSIREQGVQAGRPVVMDAQGASHDVMDHLLVGNDFTPEGEVCALAASHFSRGQFGYYAERGLNPAPDFHLYGGLLECVEGLVKETRTTIGEPPEVQAKLRSSRAEDVFSAAIERLAISLEDERHDENSPYGGFVLDEAERGRWMQWLRYGYRKAAKAYRVLGDPYEVCCLFKDLVREIGKEARNIEDRRGFIPPGTIMSARVVRSRYQASAATRIPR